LQEEGSFSTSCSSEKLRKHTSHVDRRVGFPEGIKKTKKRPALENNLRSVYVSVITTQRILVYGRIFLEDVADFMGNAVCVFKFNDLISQ
jgi:hypothetical protein